MSKPIAFTVKLHPKKRTEKSKFAPIVLNEDHILHVHSSLSKEFKKMQFLNDQRKTLGNKTILLMGNFEEGNQTDQPHIHYVVDFRNIREIPMIKWAISQAVKQVKKNTGLISDTPHIELNKEVDEGWIKYILKNGCPITLIN